MLGVKGDRHQLDRDALRVDGAQALLDGLQGGGRLWARRLAAGVGDVVKNDLSAQVFAGQRGAVLIAQGKGWRQFDARQHLDRLQRGKSHDGTNQQAASHVEQAQKKLHAITPGCWGGRGGRLLLTGLAGTAGGLRKTRSRLGRVAWARA